MMSTTLSWKSCLFSNRFWCCECTSMSCSPSSFSSDSATGVSLMNARLLPAAVSSRRTMVSVASYSISFSSNSPFSSYRDKSKCASMMHFSAPCLMAFESARCPSSSPMAPRMMDFPAPVSPVITENPLCSSISSLSISAKFLINSLFIIVFQCSLCNLVPGIALCGIDVEQ